MICCDIKLNIVTRLILGRNLVKLLILLISFIKNLFLRPKKNFSDQEEQTQHFKSSKTIPWFHHHQHKSSNTSILVLFAKGAGLNHKRVLSFSLGWFHF